jgi:hypothetical protein
VMGIMERGRSREWFSLTTFQCAPVHAFLCGEALR